LCRLCRAAMPTKHAVALFSCSAVKQKLACRLADLLDLNVSESDGLPQHACAKCVRRLGSLERAAEHLVNFRSQAVESYKVLQPTRGPLKRTKESSAQVGVSPDTKPDRLQKSSSQEDSWISTTVSWYTTFERERELCMCAYVKHIFYFFHKYSTWYKSNACPSAISPLIRHFNDVLCPLTRHVQLFPHGNRTTASAWVHSHGRWASVIR